MILQKFTTKSTFVRESPRPSGVVLPLLPFVRNAQGSDHASTKDVIDVLVQLGGLGPRSLGPVTDGSDGDAGDRIDASTMLTAEDNEDVGETDGREDGGTEVDGGASQLSAQVSTSSLLSQFPPTQEMPRAMTQSPIPLPPREDREGVASRENDDMRMSPPASAG